MTDKNEELYNSVLAVTRDQLSKSMGLNDELEALLLMERSRNEKLQAELDELKSKSEEKGQAKRTDRRGED
jgi:hypothetical protein